MGHCVRGFGDGRAKIFLDWRPGARLRAIRLKDIPIRGATFEGRLFPLGPEARRSGSGYGPDFVARAGHGLSLAGMHQPPPGPRQGRRTISRPRDLPLPESGNWPASSSVATGTQTGGYL